MSAQMAAKEFCTILEVIDNRCIHVDGPVPPTLKMATNEELAKLYELGCAMRTASATYEEVLKAASLLAIAEAEYRNLHDRAGDGAIETGRAWDRMRRAGEKLRAALAKAADHGGAE